MIIKLPHVDPIDTLNLPSDFEDRVKESFGEFTALTHEDYRHEDKLLYLDNLRGFLHPGDAGECVKNLILASTEYQLDEYGDFPDKEDFWSMEFMEECYEAGNKKYRDNYEKDSHRNNGKTLKAILKIIEIVVNWRKNETD